MLRPLESQMKLDMAPRATRQTGPAAWHQQLREGGL